jgi:hypothetical protein
MGEVRMDRPGTEEINGLLILNSASEPGEVVNIHHLSFLTDE